MLKIREMEPADISRVSEIHREVFPNDTLSDSDSMTWISSKFNGWPINRYFVAVTDDVIIGYILWTELGGLRNPCVLELEQIGIASKWQGKGFGAQIVNESIFQTNNHLRLQGRSIKLVQVTTGKSNRAQQLYAETLGATPECKISHLYDEDEVVMIARISSINEKRKSQGLPLLEVK
jgi:ribosomal protein S18 acetylase RimI-like enzyme